MTLHEICYGFEHKLLPEMFFEYKFAFVKMLLDDKTKLYKIINDIFEDAKEKNPYTEDDFDIVLAKLDENLYMLKIIFPEPKTEPLCYCSYIFFDCSFEKTGYYCIEKGNSFSGKEEPFVCSWSKEGMHFNYGNCVMEDNKDFLRCLELYLS